jgi:hypothetical protein
LTQLVDVVVYERRIDCDTCGFRIPTLLDGMIESSDGDISCCMTWQKAAGTAFDSKRPAAAPLAAAAP